MAASISAGARGRSAPSLRSRFWPSVIHMPMSPRPTRRLFVRDLTLLAQIGVWRHEHGRRQRVRISIDLEVEETPNPEDRLDGTVNYDRIIGAVREVVAAGHVRLI